MVLDQGLGHPYDRHHGRLAFGLKSAHICATNSGTQISIAATTFGKVLEIAFVSSSRVEYFYATMTVSRRAQVMCFKIMQIQRRDRIITIRKFHRHLA